MSSAPDSPPFELTVCERAVRPRRGPPAPRFKAATSSQLDPIRGCPDLNVAKDHPARWVKEWVAKLDTTLLMKGYSSLGRHGHDPRNVLAVWIYASLQGLHYATKVAAALKTDAAYLFLSEGHAVSVSVLKAFRATHGAFFEAAVAQTVALANTLKLLDPQQCAVDSMRLEAHASPASMRTLTRSTKRLDELEKTDTSTLTEPQKEIHAEKVAKHSEAVRRCNDEDRTSLSTTNASAGLLKFPSGASGPGHRIAVGAIGVKLRLIVTVLINAVANDFGQLADLVRGLRVQLIAAGIDPTTKIQVGADAGYLSIDDLRYAADNRDIVDILIHESAAAVRKGADGAYFGRDRFQIDEDGSATCPAGTRMKGPQAIGDGRRKWTGVGCAACPLRAKCTSAKERSLSQHPENEKLHDKMRERMGQPGAKERYNKRIATVEPVFSGIESMMGYRRASSRRTATIRAEIFMKVLAYNLSRLRVGARLIVVRFAICEDGSQLRILASWTEVAAPIRPEPPSPITPVKRAANAGNAYPGTGETTCFEVWKFF